MLIGKKKIFISIFFFFNRIYITKIRKEIDIFDNWKFENIILWDLLNLNMSLILFDKILK